MLHGRDAELAEIDKLLNGIREGFGGALVIQGDAGIGKSALLDLAALRAGDMTVIRGVGVESETELAFSGLHLLLSAYVHLVDRLPEPQATALRGALGLGHTPDQDRFLVGLGVLTLLSDIAEKSPVLCLIDDAHWMDQASMEALFFAARRLHAEPVALVFTTRDGKEALHAPGMPELTLSRLDGHAAASLLAAQGHDLAAHVRDWLIEGSEGIPLALIELSAALTPDQRAGLRSVHTLDPSTLPLTGRIIQTFTSQIRALPPRARNLLAVAAADCTGDAAVVFDAARHLGSSMADLEDAEDRRLLHLAGGKVVFRHPLIRAAAYATASATQRRAIHLALAHSLEGGVYAERRAWHLAAGSAEADENVAAELEDSAEWARARGGYAEVATAYERAAQLSPDHHQRARRLAHAAQAAVDAGQSEWAGKLADQASAFLVDSPTRAELIQVKGVVAYEQGNLVSAHALMLEASTSAAGRQPLRAAFLLLDAMDTAWSLGADDLIADTVARIDHIDFPDDPQVQLVLGGAHGLFRLFDGEPGIGVPALRDLLMGMGKQTRCISPRQRASIGSWGLLTGDLQACHDLALALEEDCRRQGAIGLLPRTLLRLARSQLFLGLHRDALVSATEGLRIAEDTAQHQFACLLKACLVRLAAIEGDEERCRALSEEVFAHGVALSDSWCGGALALLDLGLGRFDDALRRLESLHDNPAWRTAALYSVPDHVEAAIRVGQPERAAGHVAWFEAWATQTQQAWAQAIVMRRRALLASGEEAERCYVEALRLHTQGPPFDRARTSLLFGEWLRRNKRRTEARHHLRTAADLFQQLGARPWNERARGELRAAGDSSGHAGQGTDPLTTLTPQELQVARLAASGLSNRDIGAHLFLSPRTISYHLYKAYPKLGVSSRGELAHLQLERPMEG